MDPDASMSDGTVGDDTPNDGAPNGDGNNDAAVSYAPCPTCCDPIAQTGCNVGEACYQSPSPSTDTYCGTAGTGLVNYTCATDGGCAAGFDCETQVFHKCRAFCTSNADCPQSQCLLGTQLHPYGICL
jgi:hypothetical protein